MGLWSYARGASAAPSSLADLPLVDERLAEALEASGD